MRKPQHPLPWLEAGQDFPPVSSAWGSTEPAPGLLAAGAALDIATLVRAYSLGIFPWYSRGQPTLWWSPNPRMVLHTEQFKLHRSLRKSVQKFLAQAGCAVLFDRSFERVINACASQLRGGQPGTWILPEMVAAYCALHRAGHAHSVETWVNGELVGGLYCVSLGGMVFGESMFAHATDASKIALCALVAFCKAHGIALIDCQQNTGHLAFLGAAEISREAFTAHVAQGITCPAPTWEFDPVYWKYLLPIKTLI